jgi:hypothetical protein
MNALNSIKSVGKNPLFLDWKKSNPESYLTSAFAMLANTADEWLISYFNPKTETITTFSTVTKKSTEDAFKKEKTIPELKLEEVKISEQAALKAAKTSLETNYKENNPQKTIIVLQKLEDEPLWNITYITTTLKVANIRISAATGKEISRTMNAVSDFIQS